MLYSWCFSNEACGCLLHSTLSLLTFCSLEACSCWLLFLLCNGLQMLCFSMYIDSIFALSCCTTCTWRPAWFAVVIRSDSIQLLQHCWDVLLVAYGWHHVCNVLLMLSCSLYCSYEWLPFIWFCSIFILLKMYYLISFVFSSCKSAGCWVYSLSIHTNCHRCYVRAATLRLLLSTEGLLLWPLSGTIFLWCWHA